MSNSDFNKAKYFLGEPMENVTALTTYASYSTGENYTRYETFSKPIHVMVLLCVAYAAVFMLAIMGNCMVIGVVYRNTSMHSVTNYLLVNLAVADILVSVVCLPVTLVYNLFTSWPFGSVVCKTVPFLQGVVVSASVNTLAVVALDRYFALCHTVNFRITRKMCRIIIAVIWIGSTAIMTPWAVFFKEEKNDMPGNQTIYICREIWPDEHQHQAYFLGATLLTCYSIPLVLITICYTLIGVKICRRKVPGVQDSSVTVRKSKIKVVKMLIVVVALFAFLWLPLFALTAVFKFTPEPNEVLYSVIPWFQWLGLSQCCVNPIVYCSLSKKYRQGFQGFMKCKHDANFRQSFYRSSFKNGVAGTVRLSTVGNSSRTEQNTLLFRICDNRRKTISTEQCFTEALRLQDMTM